MHVWIIATEFNRGSDSEGGIEIEGVTLTAESAQRIRDRAVRQYRQSGLTIYDAETGESDEWDCDVQITEHQVIEE